MRTACFSGQHKMSAPEAYLPGIPPPSIPPSRDWGPGIPSPSKGPGTRHTHPLQNPAMEGTWDQGTPPVNRHTLVTTLHYLPTTSLAGRNKEG